MSATSRNSKDDGPVEHDDYPVQKSHIGSDDPDAEFGGKEARAAIEKKMLLKLDLRMSILIILYILNYIDRNNASAARLKGLEKDLNLTGQQFPSLLSILYVGYILMQIPSNLFLNYIGRPSIYLPICMLIWGMISVLTGITKDFVGALLTRFFLGFVEAAFFPGALYLMSKWYKRDELGLRYAILYCGNLSSNAFGTLIASGILSGMQGKLGHAAWRWLFYIEGALTMFFAIVAYFILPDFPENDKRLSDIERKLALRRMVEDVGEADAEKAGNSLHGFKLAMTDWKVWWMAFTLTAQVVGLSFNQYFPTLLATLGYNTTITLLLCAPPWVLAVLVTFLNARHSDKTGERFFHITIPLLFGMVGFIIALATRNLGARYFAFFLMASAYAGYVVFFAWMSNTIPRPPTKRAVGIAFMNAFSQLGNIAGSYAFPSGFGPSYRKSYGICISMFGVGIFMSLVQRQYLRKQNIKFQKEEEDRGQKEPGFRYLI